MAPVLIAGESGVVIAGEDEIDIAGDIETINADRQMFDFSVNLLAAIIWQYTSATNLQSLVQQKQNWYNANQTEFWENWIANVFNLQTANEFGLSVWSIILDFPTFINQTPTGNYQPWGFGSNNFNFGNGNFVLLDGGTIELPQLTWQRALKLRYFQLCSSGTVPEINRFLKFVFADLGEVYLVDNLNMTQTYVFLFPVTWDLILLFENFDILPRPAGVQSTFRDASVNYWGFGSNRLNFGNGNFGA